LSVLSKENSNAAVGTSFQVFGVYEKLIGILYLRKLQRVRICGTHSLNRSVPAAGMQIIMPNAISHGILTWPVIVQLHEFTGVLIKTANNMAVSVNLQALAVYTIVIV
jgi:hypothetical protein